MVLVAQRTTYGIEDVGGGVEVRRRVVAGQRVPGHLDVEGGAAKDVCGACGRPLGSQRPKPKPKDETELGPETPGSEA